VTDITPPGTPSPPEDVPVHQLSKEAATAKLDELTKQFNAASGRDNDPFTAGQEHSTAELKRLQKETLKILADPVGAALTGELPSGVMLPFGEEGQTIASAKLATLVEDLREAGLSDGSIKQALLPERHVEDPRWIEAAAQKQGELLGNKEWVKSLLEGDREKFKQLLLLETVLMTPAKAK
jgi:hypothetical protein